MVLKKIADMIYDNPKIGWLSNLPRWVQGLSIGVAIDLIILAILASYFRWATLAIIGSVILGILLMTVVAYSRYAWRRKQQPGSDVAKAWAIDAWKKTSEMNSSPRASTPSKEPQE